MYNILKCLLFVLNFFPQVSELSRPSSVEVEDIIHQLVQNVVRRLFKNDPTTSLMGDSAIANTENYIDGTDEFCDSMCTSRDYLAKLLFWLVFCL